MSLREALSPSERFIILVFLGLCDYGSMFRDEVSGFLDSRVIALCRTFYRFVVYKLQEEKKRLIFSHWNLELSLLHYNLAYSEC